MSFNPFQGLKVIDASSWIAAPTCAAMFADRGADVIKIEAPEVGDAYRGYYQMPPSPNAEINYTWILDNHSKRSITLNLKTDEGKAILHKLVEECDIYITNQPQSMRRAFGLTYEDLAPLNERMIYASLTAYGEDGPERDREGFDLVAYYSRSGLLNQMRHEGVEPYQAMAGMGDHPTGIALFASIVSALWQRDHTGEGTHVHTSLLANGLWSASCFAQASWTDADFSQIPSQRLQTALYLTKDNRWIQFTMVRTEELFDRLVMAMEQVEWLADDRFNTPEARLEHHATLTPLMREVMATRTAAEWIEIFRQHDVPAALVAEFQDLPDDQQVDINAMAETPAEDIGLGKVIRDPVNVAGIEKLPARQAPDAGEHSSEVLAELGYTNEQIAALKDKGVI